MPVVLDQPLGMLPCLIHHCRKNASSSHPLPQTLPPALCSLLRVLPPVLCPSAARHAPPYLLRLAAAHQPVAARVGVGVGTAGSTCSGYCCLLCCTSLLLYCTPWCWSLDLLCCRMAAAVQQYCTPKLLVALEPKLAVNAARYTRLRNEHLHTWSSY